MQITPELLNAMIGVVGPIIVNLVTKHHNETGQIMTIDELKAKLATDAAAILAEGQAFKDAHPGT